MKNKCNSNTQGRGWSWQSYLEEHNAEAAPVSLFTPAQCWSGGFNGFKAGMKLEGIDPLHPSMFCVLSVAEVIGHRLRLHIEGYDIECYDFWVNADSPDIKAPGWCRDNNRKLYPPKGYSEKDFDWQKFLQSTKSQSAPGHFFKTHNTGECAFETGMRLEAVDKKNPSLVCVASVADVINMRLLVHFDNWDDSYDYWCDSSSPYIHPVGWCEEQGRPLTAPQGHPKPEEFLWEEYLQEKDAKAAPKSDFKPRAPHGFCVNHRLEAVDRRNPMLVRVVTVTETDDHRVKLHYDGWSHQLDVWLDSDDPDLHPIGWCGQTGHPLETPPGPAPVPCPQGVCPTPGCRGVGHIKGAKYTGHHSAFGCPYSDMNLRKEAPLPDRLGVGRFVTLVPVFTTHHRGDQTHRVEVKSGGARPRGRPPGGLLLKKENREEVKRRGEPRECQPLKYLRVKEEEAELEVSAFIPGVSVQPGLRGALHQSVFMSSAVRELPLCWEQHVKLLPGVQQLTANTKPNTWSIQQVSDFVESLPGCEGHAKLFKEQQIDGRAFLLLTQQDIVRIMSIKLGPALKIYNSILMFNHADDKKQSQPIKK